MAAILLASACPAVQALSGSVYRNSGTESNALVAPNVPGSVNWRVQANQIGTILDQTGRYGGGIIGIPDGPTKIILGVGSALLLAVGAGHAMIGGSVEIATATTIAVPDNTARVWIWLQQTGPALTYTTTTTKPAGECALLGSCVTSGGAITSVDTSGVVYLRGGIGWRQTADYGMPSDSPPSTVMLFSQTTTGTYLWDGSHWQQVTGGAVLTDTVASGASVSVADGQQLQYFDSLTVYGTFADYGKVRIL